jgi:hypothetical protein
MAKQKAFTAEKYRELNIILNTFMGNDSSCIIMYHCCWNSLMKVVDKIEDTVSGIGFNIRPTQCIIDEQYSNNRFLDEDSLEFKFKGVFTVGTDRKEAAYFAVVEFVKWYNTTTHNNINCPMCGYPKFKKHHEDFDRCEACDWTSKL